jgi:hypothetical protein
MKYVITQADNGWIGTITHEEEKEVIVKEVKNMDDFADFLYQVFRDAVETSRYSEGRLHVLSVPGDKYEGKLTDSQRSKCEDLRDYLNELLEVEKDLL